MPLHPKYTYFYHDVTRQDINQLITFLHENIGISDINMDINGGNGNAPKEEDVSK